MVLSMSNWESRLNSRLADLEKAFDQKSNLTNQSMASSVSDEPYISVNDQETNKGNLWPGEITCPTGNWKFRYEQDSTGSVTALRLQRTIGKSVKEILVDSPEVLSILINQDERVIRVRKELEEIRNSNKILLRERAVLKSMMDAIKVMVKDA